MAHTRYVLGFMFDRHPEPRHVLLVEKTAPEWQAGKLNGVGGKVERDEDPRAAMVREFYEETGIRTWGNDWDERMTLEGSGWEVVVFRAYGSIDEAKQMTPADTPFPVNPRFLPHTVIPNLHWIVPFLLDEDANLINGKMHYA